MEGSGTVIGKPAENFTLTDHTGKNVTLNDCLKSAPALLVFYPGDFTPVCTKQLCNYRDNLKDFEQFGVKILGISANPPESHAEFVKEYDFPFPLLSDPGKKIAKAYGCTSMMMLGGVSRAVVLINQKGLVLYRYVEPTALTRRKADELIGIIADLRANKLL